MTTYKFYFSDGTMKKIEFENDHQASEFAWLEGSLVTRWCTDRSGQEYDFVNGVWIET